MLTDNRPMCFVATADPARARAFYCDVLGLTLTSDEDYALVYDLAGTMLRIQKVQALTPLPYTALGWHVADITRAVAELSARGVTFERWAFLEQDAAGIWTVPGAGAKVAWFKDPDGNLLSLTEGA